MTRLQEIQLILNGLEKEKRDINTFLSKVDGLLLSGSKAAARDQLLERETVIDSELVKYVEEEKDIRWAKSINSIKN